MQGTWHICMDASGNTIRRVPDSWYKYYITMSDEFVKAMDQAAETSRNWSHYDSRIVNQQPTQAPTGCTNGRAKHGSVSAPGHPPPERPQLYESNYCNYSNGYYYLWYQDARTYPYYQVYPYPSQYGALPGHVNDRKVSVREPINVHSHPTTPPYTPPQRKNAGAPEHQVIQQNFSRIDSFEDLIAKSNEFTSYINEAYAAVDNLEGDTKHWLYEIKIRNYNYERMFCRPRH